LDASNLKRHDSETPAGVKVNHGKDEDQNGYGLTLTASNLTPKIKKVVHHYYGLYIQFS
jgi:hypothetical protein